jgi:hypothetical protein
MKQIKVSTPPPPVEFDLTDDDLLVIKSAIPDSAPDVSLTSVTHSVNPIMAHSDFIATTPPDTSKRNRVSIRFSLNLRNKVEYDLAAWLDPLRQERQFTGVIRDALRLYRDLRAGQYTVLRELFPGVVERVIAENCTASAQFDRLLRELSEIKTTPSTGPQPLKTNLDNIKNLAPDDDVKLDIKKAKSDGSASQNFLDSAFSIARQ